jgi:murein DD-endopeptidase MepM/ murein hydrolase activator NlpD
MRSRWGLACLVAAAGALSRSPGPLQPEYHAVFEPEQPVQGQTVRLSLAGVPAWLPVECRYEGKPVPIENLPDGTRRALIPESGDAAGREPVMISVPGPRGWSLSAELPVRPGSFPASNVHVAKDVWELFQNPEAAKANERLRAVFESYTHEQYWSGRFSDPVAGRQTTPYGARRLMQGQLKYYHKGIDMAAPKGTVVRAANSGVVRLAEPLPLQGNVVVVDHGYGVETLYQHLSALLVKPGARVTKGEPVGRVGSTGISTGPHLHWGLYVRGTAVDPQDWIRRDF